MLRWLAARCHPATNVPALGRRAPPALRWPPRPPRPRGEASSRESRSLRGACLLALILALAGAWAQEDGEQPRGCDLCRNKDGSCVETDITTCDLLWEYRNCTSDVLVPCHGHGVCVEQRCACDRGYSGPQCDSCMVTHVDYPSEELDPLLGQTWSFDCVYTLCITDQDTGEVCNGAGVCSYGTMSGSSRYGYFCDCELGYVRYRDYRCYDPNCYDIPSTATTADLEACSGHGSCLERIDGGRYCYCDATFTGSYCNECHAGSEYYRMADGTTACHPPSCMSSTNPGVLCGDLGTCQWNDFAMKYQCACEDPLVSITNNCIHKDCASTTAGGFIECSGRGGCVAVPEGSQTVYRCRCSPDVYAGLNCGSCAPYAIRIGADCVHQDCVEDSQKPAECGGNGDCYQTGSGGSYSCVCHSSDESLTKYCTTPTNNLLIIIIAAMAAAVVIFIIVVVSMYYSLRRKSIRHARALKEANMVRVEGEWIPMDVVYQHDFTGEEVLYL